MGAESKQLILGVDGGATKTGWVLCEEANGVLTPVREGRLGPGNMRLLDADGLRRLLEALPPEARRIGLYLAGCATKQDREFLRHAALPVWPLADIHTGSDRDSAFAAAFGEDNGIVVIAGTGSAITGCRDGRTEHAGGWGHLLGDTGGGYDLAIHALRRILFDYDTGRQITPLGHEVLRTLGLNTLRELTQWAQTAEKSDLARLTPILFEHAVHDEAAATLSDGAWALAELTASVARRLEYERPPVRLTGSLFVRQPLYAELFSTAFATLCPGAEVTTCEISPSLGAARLASGLAPLAAAAGPDIDHAEIRAATTEQANPRSHDLDLRPVRELVELFVHEEHFVQEALAACADVLAAAVETCVAALEKGGRLFYAGAGTSGRLGVLDASEMPPTFGVPRDLVQAIIAGGAPAIQQSVEGAEDDPLAGAQAVTERGVRGGDVLCGIAASGRTPFVHGALAASRQLGAKTILLTCNPARRKDRAAADVEIDLPTGPELITGSTRLKAGTATKVALNIITSCTMVRLGYVHGNFMSNLQPANLKLRDRATRIVAARLGLAEPEAKKRLECANWNMRAALGIKARPNGGRP